MKCPECGAENPEGNRFCGACGEGLTKDQDAAQKSTGRTCSSCGHSLPEEANQCPYCGRWVQRKL